MYRNEKNIEIFNDTLKWIDEDPDLAASVAEAKKNTWVFFEDDYPDFDASKMRQSVIEVTGDGSFQAAMRLGNLQMHFMPAEVLQREVLLRRNAFAGNQRFIL